MSKISFKNINKSFGNNKVINNLTLSLQKIVTIIKENVIRALHTKR